MAISFYILTGLLILGVAIALLPMELRVRYKREGEEDLLRVELSIWPGLSLGFKLDMIDFRSSMQWSVLRIKGEVLKGSRTSRVADKKRFSPRELILVLRRLSGMADLLKTIRPSIGYMLGRIELVRLTWYTELGVGDPYLTALATGAAWSLKGFIAAAAGNFLKISGTPFFSIKPHFNKRCLSTSLDCILRTRTGHIIFTGLRMTAALIISGKAVKLINMFRKPGRRYGYARTSH